MKTNKRIALILAALVAAAGILIAVFAARRQYVPPRPEDTTLELWICDDVSKFDWTGHEEIPGHFGGSEYLGKGYSAQDTGARVTYTVTAWPDYADGGAYVTKISITDPTVSVYGLTVSSSPDEFKRVFASMGYEVKTTGEGSVSAERDGFIFTLDLEDAPEVRILALVTNREGIMF